MVRKCGAPEWQAYLTINSSEILKENKEFKVVVTVASRHMDITPAMKQHAEQKANKLLKFYDQITEIEVVFDAGRDKHAKDNVEVEIIVHVQHQNKFIAKDNSGDAYASVDACAEKLERQLSDHKKLHRNRKHPNE